MELFAELGFVFDYDVAIADDTAWGMDSDASQLAAGDVAVYTTFRLNSTCMAGTWYASNSILCLRSLLFYKHSPVCTIYIPGQGHLVDFNGVRGFLNDYDAGKLIDLNVVLGSFFACDEAPSVTSMLSSWTPMP